MKNKRENYQRYLVIGLVFVLIILAAFSIYWLTDSGRLVKAAGELDEERVSRGQEIYNQQCVTCHGAEGEGGIGPALNNRDLLKNTPDDLLFSVIRSGVPSTQMPAWSINFGGPLTDEDVKDVVAFLNSWESTAPVIEPPVFEPDSGRGALLFESTCAICHGSNGAGSDKAPAINDTERLGSLEDDWYRAVIRNGRPAKGMPTWGTVLSPNQIEDLIALIDVWREGGEAVAAFSVTDLIASAVYALQNEDAESAALQIERALKSVPEGPVKEVLLNAQAQLSAGDTAGTLETMQALSQDWPIGDSTNGATVYSQRCAPCHAAGGEGGIGVSLNPNEYVQSLSNAELVEFLKEGRLGTAMAGFEGRLTEQELADVVAFLRLWQP